MPVIEWFAYTGPNRRTDHTVVEITLKFRSADRQCFPQRSSEIKDILVRAGVLTPQESFPEIKLPDERMAWYSTLLLETAKLFQRKAGHPVSFSSTACEPEQSRCIALLEYEHHDVGLTAVKLAFELMSGKREQLKEPFRLFSEFARQRRLPVETRAIMKAARRENIPCIRLEQVPYKRDHFDELTGGRCIRENGLLMLGHGVNQHVLDGAFCLDSPVDLRGFLDDKDRRRALLETLNIPLTVTDESRGNDRREFSLYAANGRVTAVTGPRGCQNLCLEDVHADHIKHALVINQAVEFAPVAVLVSTADIAKPLTLPAEGIVDFELAPQFDLLVDGQTDQQINGLNLTADAIINWLFPDKNAVRMPIIAVTGTNGKTTTTRMINHILMSAGHKPGMVCTDAVFFNGKEVEKGDKSTPTGHLKVLTSKAVDIAVLETHHAGMISRGFAFQWCDIAICLNVSEDHLGVAGIDTVEQMAEIKRALPERARNAVVLNADDPYCLDMLQSVTARKVCLVSMESTVEELLTARHVNSNACFCVLERLNDEEWLVIYNDGHRLPVLASSQIPATFDGLARFNVSNAMHATVACYMAGVEIELISEAMQRFVSSYEATPGRMNVFDELPFKIIMDFAHNPDGFKNIAQFVDRQAITGRKLVAFAGTVDRTDETLMKMSHELAGHFDFYFCKDHVPLDARNPRKKRLVAHIMQQGLLEAGVPESQTAVFKHGKEVIFEIFDVCEPGDLLIMLLGYVEKNQLPEYISEYARRTS
jgi:UDP-N-acetylmuramyl tripeptide synthase